MTREEAIKIIRDMAYLSGHIVDRGVEAFEFIEKALNQPSLPSTLEETAEKCIMSLMHNEADWKIPSDNPELSEFVITLLYNMFKAGAQWRDAQIPKLPEGLDEAAKEYAWKKEEPLMDGERLSVCFNPRIDAFKAGVEWMASQIKKK